MKRSRFEEFVRVEFRELRARCLAEHMQEVAELVEENADLRKDLTAALCGATEEHADLRQAQRGESIYSHEQQETHARAQFAKRSQSERPGTGSRLFEDMPMTHSESSRRTWCVEPGLVHVTPPMGPGTTHHQEIESESPSTSFDPILPAGFIQHPHQPRGPSHSASSGRRGHHKSSNTAPTDSQSDEDGEAATLGLPPVHHSVSGSVLSTQRLDTGWMKEVRPHSHNSGKFHTGSITSRWISKVGGPRVSPPPHPSRPHSPTLATTSVLPTAQPTVPPEPEYQSEAAKYQSEAAKEGEEAEGNDGSNNKKRISQGSIGSMGSMEGDTDFEVSPEWTTSRRQTNFATCKRRSMDMSSSTLELPAAARTSEHGLHISFDGGEVEQWLHNHMLAPSGPFNACWLSVALACMMWDLVLIPMDLFNPEEGDFVIATFWLVRLYWTLDLPKNFFTGRLQADGFVETRPWLVAKQYARTWLPLDLVCFLCDWIIPFVDRGTALQGVRLLRLARLLRLVKVTRLESVISQYTCSETVVLLVGLVKLIVVLLALAHLIACAWYRIGMGSLHDDSASPSGWVAHHGLEDATLQDRYAWSLHWSLAQFTGEMIFEPRNSSERSFAIFVLVVAFLVSSLFVSGITTQMTRLLFVAGSQSSQLQALRRYLFDLRISSSLTARLQRNAQHVLAQQKKTAPQIMSLISEPLRVELYYELHSPALLQHPFFKGYDQVHPASVRRVCHTAVRTVLLSRGDVVFSDYEAPACPRMYFCHGSGGLRYRQANQPVQFVETGDWVCEPVLWTTWIHCGSLTASHECELMALDALAFRGVANLFPTRHAAKYAMAFVLQLNKVDRVSLSDLWQPDFDEIMEAAMKGNTSLFSFSSKQDSITQHGLGLPGAAHSTGMPWTRLRNFLSYGWSGGAPQARHPRGAAQKSAWS